MYKNGIWLGVTNARGKSTVRANSWFFVGGLSADQVKGKKVRRGLNELSNLPRNGRLQYGLGQRHGAQVQADVVLGISRHATERLVTGVSHQRDDPVNRVRIRARFAPLQDEGVHHRPLSP